MESFQTHLNHKTCDKIKNKANHGITNNMLILKEKYLLLLEYVQ